MKPGEIFILMSTVLLVIIMSLFIAWEPNIWSLIVICTMIMMGMQEQNHFIEIQSQRRMIKTEIPQKKT
jgi:urea transporter